jgi:uncharacterized protein (TIGR02266 family)
MENVGSVISRRNTAMPNRKYRRIQFVSKAMVRASNQSFDAYTENLSVNGLFIRTERRLPVGNRAEIKLEIPSASSDSSFAAHVRVIRSDDNGMALQFRSLDHDSFSRLQRVIKNKSANRLKEHYYA